jgi:hypothetical protein
VRFAKRAINEGARKGILDGLKYLAEKTGDEWAERNRLPYQDDQLLDLADEGKLELQRGDDGEILTVRLVNSAPVEKVDPRDAFWAEAKRGRAAGNAREASFQRFADDFSKGFMENDRVQLDEEGREIGTVEQVDTDDKIKVRRDKGGEVLYDKDSANDLKRVQANQPADRVAEPQHHAPKGMHSSGPKGSKVADPSGTMPRENDTARQDDDGWLEPLKDVVAVVRWPNMVQIPLALPKLAGPSWLQGVERAVVRAGGDCEFRPEAYELEARFPSAAMAQRFAARLVAEFYIKPTAIEASLEESSPTLMRLGAHRVDLTRRAWLPGGMVFAMAEGETTSVAIGDRVLVAGRGETVLSHLDPKIATVTDFDGYQYEYDRQVIRRMISAKLHLADYPGLPVELKGMHVTAGNVEGRLGEVTASGKAYLTTSEGPRTVLVKDVVLSVRVADLSPLANPKDTFTNVHPTDLQEEWL